MKQKQTRKRPTGTKKPTAKRKEKRQPQEWVHGHLEVNEDLRRFKGSCDLPEEVKGLKQPYDILKYFFTNELFVRICDESLRYLIQKDPSKPKSMSPKDIERYLGVTIFSSISNCTSVRYMWHPIRGHATVINCMTVNTSYESIRSVIHFNDNSQQEAPDDPNRDRLYKLRPVIDRLNEKFLSIPMRASLSIDKPTCTTKTKHYIRLYNPKKPQKWGYKLYVLCDDKGFAHKFEVYSGQAVGRMNDEPDLGTTGNLVVRLAREVQITLPTATTSTQVCPYSLTHTNKAFSC